MKIVVTGSSRGLGKAIADYYNSHNHRVLKLTHKTDLRDWTVRQNLYKQIDDFDIFVSVAKPDFVQTELLYELYDLWQNKNNFIISIGSGIVKYDTWGNSIERMKYHTQKKSLQHATQQLQRLNNPCRVININPTHLYDSDETINYVFLQNWCKDNLEFTIHGC